MYDLIGSWDKDGKVNSGFGYRPSSATNGVGSTNHKGIDLSSNHSNIPSVQAGTVIENQYHSARGWYVTVQHADGYTTRYQHLASQSPLAVGSKVSEGQTLGTQGSTGNSTGPHLHFEVKSAAGLYVDPVEYLSGKLTGDSVSSSVLTDANGRPVSNAAGSGGAVSIMGGGGLGESLLDILLEVLGKVIKFVAVIAIVILGLVFFMKSFNIKVRR